MTCRPLLLLTSVAENLELQQAPAELRLERRAARRHREVCGTPHSLRVVCVHCGLLLVTACFLGSVPSRRNVARAL